MNNSAFIPFLRGVGSSKYEIKRIETSFHWKIQIRILGMIQLDLFWAILRALHIVKVNQGYHVSKEKKTRPKIPYMVTQQMLW